MPRTLRRFLVTFFFPGVMLVALATGAIAGSNNQKVTLCHVTGNGSYHQITVSVNALPAHLRHGDVLPDDYGDGP